MYGLIENWYHQDQFRGRQAEKSLYVVVFWEDGLDTAFVEVLLIILTYVSVVIELAFI